MNHRADTSIPPPDHTIVNIHDDPAKKKETNKTWEQVKFWTRRIVVGKNYEEEQEEKKNHKWLNRVKKELRRHAAEFIGTFFLILFIAGIEVVQKYSNANSATGNGGVANLDKGIVGGFVLAGLIYAFGSISGAHFNPTVTLAFMLRGVFNPLRAITYIITQFAGAVLAASILYAIFGNIAGLGTTTPTGRDVDSFGVEILISFILITVILSTAEKAQILGPVAAIAVGGTFTALLTFAWNISGASANPWRTFGPTLISNVGWKTIWVYIVGPLIGMLMAVLVQRFMTSAREEKGAEDAAKGDGDNAKS